MDKEDYELSDHAKRKIAQAEADIEAGRMHSLEQVVERYGLTDI